MKCMALTALVGAALLSGCASDAAKSSGHEVAERSGATSLGSYIPRKNTSQENVKTVDRQAMENDRIMNSGVNNGPGGK
jgi:hypothetical protein